MPQSSFLKSRNKKILSLVFSLGILTSCGVPYLKGVTLEGRKVYLGPVPIESTEAYRNFLQSKRTEVDKQRYLFQRLKDSQGLEFYRDGTWYNALQAYRGGMWLMRNRYQKGQDTRSFILKYVDRSEQTGKLHLVKYPDGSLQLGSSILFNELDLLEEKKGKNENT